MNWYNRVVWSEGLFLRPQLFQQQERYLEHFAHKRATPLSPFFWGFNNYVLDTEYLNLGKLVLASAAGVFSDGTPFDTPGFTILPKPLNILPEHVEQIIYLAVPIRTPNGEETDLDNNQASLARFNIFDYELCDANSNGQGAKSVQLSSLHLRLLPAKELTDSWLGIPLTKVIALRPDGSVTLDSNFIPPVSCYSASILLTQWLNKIHGLTHLRANSLAKRLTGSDGKSSEAAEVSDYLLLQLLNRYEPILEHFLKVQETQPEVLYTTFLSMEAELATFVRVETRRPKTYHPYQHNDPYLSFHLLSDELHHLLNEVLIRSAEHIFLDSKGNGMSVASIDPTLLKSFASIVLAVAADMPAELLAKQFSSQSKVGPTERLPDLVRSHLPGVALQLLPVPPRQIPFNAGFVYYQLDTRSLIWEQIAQYGGLSLHVAGNFPNLRLELWGVR